MCLVFIQRGLISWLSLLWKLIQRGCYAGTAGNKVPKDVIHAMENVDFFQVTLIIHAFETFLVSFCHAELECQEAVPKVNYFGFNPVAILQLHQHSCGVECCQYFPDVDHCSLKR